MREQRIFEFNLLEIEGIVGKYVKAQIADNVTLAQDKEKDLFTLSVSSEDCWEYNTPFEIQDKLK